MSPLGKLENLEVTNFFSAFLEDLIASSACCLLSSSSTSLAGLPALESPAWRSSCRISSIHHYWRLLMSASAEDKALLRAQSEDILELNEPMKLDKIESFSSITLIDVDQREVKGRGSCVKASRRFIGDGYSVNGPDIGGVIFRGLRSRVVARTTTSYRTETRTGVGQADLDPKLSVGLRALLIIPELVAYVALNIV
ncbi:hypothetical protein ACH5RR_021815 [Cinchona calisaya]|uniref:Uncharacterized protein n=1 Tax=Cinchona calisaya TaxID=153742 RepID=A0ABD2ZIG0_9GENT